MKVILAADGSECAGRAVRYVATNRATFGKYAEIHLVHAEPPLPGRATAAVSRSVVQGFYKEQSTKALSAARRDLARRRVPFKEVHLVGDPGTAIARYATEGNFSMVVMGSHGQGAISAIMLGSVVRKVIAGCKVPLLIIR